MKSLLFCCDTRLREEWWAERGLRRRMECFWWQLPRSSFLVMHKFRSEVDIVGLTRLGI
jgi:hypothetical protein